jgi:hypothetical protein
MGQIEAEEIQLPAAIIGPFAVAGATHVTIT